MILLTLKHMRPGVLTMEVADMEERAFSSMDKAEEWLQENNFYRGRRSFFKYKGDAYDWCHADEMSWDFVDVEVTEYDVDDATVSRYKDFHFKLAPWHEAARRDGFIEGMRKQGFSADEIRAIYEKHFGEKCNFILKDPDDSISRDENGM